MAIVLALKLSLALYVEHHLSTFFDFLKQHVQKGQQVGPLFLVLFFNASKWRAFDSNWYPFDVQDTPLVGLFYVFKSWGLCFTWMIEWALWLTQSILGLIGFIQLQYVWLCHLSSSLPLLFYVRFGLFRIVRASWF